MKTNKKTREKKITDMEDNSCSCFEEKYYNILEPTKHKDNIIGGHSICFFSGLNADYLNKLYSDKNDTDLAEGYYKWKKALGEIEDTEYNKHITELNSLRDTINFNILFELENKEKYKNIKTVKQTINIDNLFPSLSKRYETGENKGEV